VTYRDLGELGKIYQSGEIIVRQGEAGDCMYFVQSGKVEVIKESEGREVKLAELGPGNSSARWPLEKDVALRDGPDPAWWRCASSPWTRRCFYERSTTTRRWRSVSCRRCRARIPSSTTS